MVNYQHEWLSCSHEETSSIAASVSKEVTASWVSSVFAMSANTEFIAPPIRIVVPDRNIQSISMITAPNDP